MTPKIIAAPLILLTQQADARWRIINDGVMGGRSSSRISSDKNHQVYSGLIFSGTLSLENNGGFASASRTLDTQEQTALQESARRIIIDIVGDGRTYQLRISTASASGTTGYKAPLPTIAGKKQTQILTADQFIETYRGQDYPSRPAPDLTQLSAIGILLADKHPGPFEIKLLSLQIE